MPCTHRHARFFVTPIDFFWDLTEKSRGFEPLTFEKTSPSLIDGAVFSAASFAEVTFGGALGPKARAQDFYARHGKGDTRP